MDAIGRAVKHLAEKFSDVQFAYVLHRNPNARLGIGELSRLDNVHVFEPMNYPSFVDLLSRSMLVLTDSGGVQEEAVSLCKTTLVMRSATERPEASSLVKVVGPNEHRIISHSTDVLCGRVQSGPLTPGENPYGDGTASVKIVNIIQQWLTDKFKK
jgi:UDP-N-acetylglucosamine 2-epimerase (non-hydrolysing)